MASERGLAGLAFADAGEEKGGARDMRQRWPNASYVEDTAGTAALARRIFDPKRWCAEEPLRVVLTPIAPIGVRVWGRSRSDDSPPTHRQQAVRSQGRARLSAVARTRFNSWCRAIAWSVARRAHRLSLGITRKHAMLGWEAGHAGQA